MKKTIYLDGREVIIVGPDMKKVYLAGPLFSEAERAFNLLIEACCLEAGFEVFLPQRDAPVLTAENGSEVFGAELRAIHAADLIVANLDGMDVDSGTAWECGYAIPLGKSVIGIRTDWRSFSPHERVNLMIEQSSFIVRSLPELKRALLAYVD
jgi:nucleoside 2-deoxyribosyltransferase